MLTVTRRTTLAIVAAASLLAGFHALAQEPEPEPAGDLVAGDDRAAAEADPQPGDAPTAPDDGSGVAEEGSGAAATAPPGVPRTRLEESIDAFFGRIVAVMGKLLFFDLPGVRSASGAGVPFIVAWLFFGAVIFTIWMKFVNFRAFRHAFDVVRGAYDDPEDEGEVSHAQALSSALSATVGLGNIAGVAIAVSAGGPGAIFWMIVAAFFGMTSKFVECTLGQKYRKIDERGHVLGGPMRYLEVGLAARGMPRLGKVLALVFAVFCIGGSFGGGNMFQANQAYASLNAITDFHVPGWAFGLFMMGAVGVVILGGIRRIAATAEKIVPLMCAMYVIAAVFVVLVNIQMLDEALAEIFRDAFTGNAIGGGVLGVMVMGIKRAAFSNEAGIGSAAIAHSAAKTNEPVREGVVALLEPFIDTVIVCLSTAIVIVISGVLHDPALSHADGAVLTAAAFKTVIRWFPVLLTVAILLFAYSTMISWSYYGERCWTLLFGAGSSLSYRVVFLGFIFVGSVSNLGAVLDFSDLMILSMAFPNILGMYLLAGTVRQDLDSYLARLGRGEFRRFR